MKSDERVPERVYEYCEDKWLLHETDIGLYLFRRLENYARDVNRKPASLAYTAGLTRVAAGLVEDAARAERERILLEVSKVRQIVFADGFAVNAADAMAERCWLEACDRIRDAIRKGAVSDAN